MYDFPFIWYFTGKITVSFFSDMEAKESTQSARCDFLAYAVY